MTPPGACPVVIMRTACHSKLRYRHISIITVLTSLLPEVVERVHTHSGSLKSVTNIMQAIYPVCKMSAC